MMFTQVFKFSHEKFLYETFINDFKKYYSKKCGIWKEGAVVSFRQKRETKFVELVSCKKMQGMLQ